MRYMSLQKNKLTEFVSSLQKKYKVVAPVKKENLFVFAPIENPEEVCIDYMPTTILPPKKFFLPQHERLGTFSKDEVSMAQTTIDVEPTVLLGVHPCDIEGIECLDIVFHDSPQDPYFSKRKKSILIIGYECMKPCDEYSTCFTMDTLNPRAGYDVMITDAGDKYIFYINSTEGMKIIEKNPLFEKVEDEYAMREELLNLREKKVKNFKALLNADYKELNKIFKVSYTSDVWKDVGKRCVSCGNCTAVCPTCYCFDIYDEVKLDMSGGERRRMWDSCQLDEFATVAGGENFRKERSSRQRHRYYRKFDYSVMKYNKFFCVGCGRCTRTCMAGISLVETVNDLTKEYKNEK